MTDDFLQELEQAEKLNVVHFEREMRQSRARMIRQRTFAGLYRALEKIPEIEHVYIDFQKNFGAFISLSENSYEFDLFRRNYKKAPSDIDEGVARRFCKLMKPTYEALPKSKATRQSLQDRWPSSCSGKLSRATVMQICRALVQNDDLRLTEEHVQSLTQSRQLDMQTPTPTEASPYRGPRL